MTVESYTHAPGIRDPFYTSAEWRQFAAGIRERDGHRCTVARLLGGTCSGPLHVNHIRPRRTHPHLQFDPDNCGSACARHHPMWEALRRKLVLAREQVPECRHRHPYREGREACRRRRAREMGVVLEDDLLMAG